MYMLKLFQKHFSNKPHPGNFDLKAFVSRLFSHILDNEQGISCITTRLENVVDNLHNFVFQKHSQFMHNFLGNDYASKN